MVPWFKEQGANLYAKGANIGLLNITFITLGTFLGEMGAASSQGSSRR